MTNLYSAFKTDSDLEKNGIVLQYGLNSKNKPIEFRIARAGGANARYAKVLEHKIKPHRRMIQNGNIAEEVAMAAIRETFVETVLIGWDGVEDENNERLEFSKENALKLFIDLPDLFRDIKEQAENGSLFRAEMLDEEAKN